MVVIGIIAAPASSPQIQEPSLRGVEHPLAAQVMEEMHRHPGPVALWSLINNLVKPKHPQTRDARRCLTLRFWGAVNALLGVRLLCRRGPLISRSDFAVEPKRRPGSLSPTASKSSWKTAGSNVCPHKPGNKPAGGELQPNQLVIEDLSHTPGGKKTQSAPTRAEISAAAKALATLPRLQKRVWTGRIAGVRFWRGRSVLLPNNEQAHVYWCGRGRVLLMDAHDVPYKSWLLRVARRERELRIYKNPAAVVLGRQKLGKKESRSATKAAAARINGRRPVRPSSRPRGRPRKLAGRGSFATQQATSLANANNSDVSARRDASAANVPVRVQKSAYRPGPAARVLAPQPGPGHAPLSR